MEKPIPLKRSLGLPMLTFYGVGTIVGGGFYALVGEVGGRAGMLTPWAFLLASLIGLLCACSFAELSSRFPVSAGESQYALEAFGNRKFSAAIGWLVILTGIVSAATLARAFARFAGSLTGISDHWIVLAVTLFLGLVAAWGIAESVWLAAVITLIEVGGLLYVLAIGGEHLAEAPARWRELAPGWRLADWSGIMLGGYLAFYSFVGFEDLVNVAEEVKKPRRNLPLAIFLSLGLSSLLYALVTLVAVLAIPPEQLAAHKSPLSLLTPNATAAKMLTCIGMLAGVNGALIQIVMASRVAYGMSKNGLAPKYLAAVNPRSQTPIAATLSAVLVVLALGFLLHLAFLAQLTSTILLAIYAVVNLSLLVIRFRDDPAASHEGVQFPVALPILGFAACLVFLGFRALAFVL